MRKAYLWHLLFVGVPFLLAMMMVGCSQTTSPPTTIPDPSPSASATPAEIVEPKSTPTPAPTPTTASTPVPAPKAPPTPTLAPRATPSPVPTPTHKPAPTLTPIPTSTPAPASTPTLTAPSTQTPTISLAQIPLPASEIADRISSPDARITSLRFFESPFDGVTRERRVYSLEFPRSTTRLVNWELSLAFPTPGRAVDFGIDTVYHRDDGSILVQQSTAVTIQPDWTSSRHTVGSGWSDPGEWAAGRYSAELSIDGQLVATAWFEITEDPQLILDQGSPLTLPIQLQQLAERLPWTQDGLSYVEQRALAALWHVHQEDRELASYVASLPWTLDSITSDERGALEHLALLAKQDIVLASGLARLPWLADHVSSEESAP